jgi:predicted outer membrane repeat protein
MKKLLLLLLLNSSFFIVNSFAQTYISQGVVSGVWISGSSPYYIQGDITIPNDSTLTIEPGVLIEFQGHYALNVQGRLLAVGTENNNITFTINDTTGFHNPDTTLGGWYGIRFIDTPEQNDTSKIMYCDISYGKAVGPGQPNNSGGAIFISNFNKVLISNSRIIHNSAGGLNSPSGGGLFLHNANGILEKNVISNNSAWDGGGIQIWESNILFRDNIISKNIATAGGGGVWIGGLSNTEFINDSISDNLAGDIGGGIVCWQTTNTTFGSVNIVYNVAYNGGGATFIECEAQFNQCNISDNSAGGSGGGINTHKCSIEINKSSFERDTSSLFGGAIVTYNSSLNINDCNLIDNGTVIRGGAIHSTFCNLNISNSTFERDTANIFGGAIATENTEMFLNNCNLIDNRAGVSGGGIHSDYSNINISNTTFERDTSKNAGGGIFTWLCDSQVNDCDFIENSAINGGAISSSNSDLLMDSCWFYQNSAQNQGGAIEYIADTSGFISVAQLEVSNSKFEENSALTRCGVALIDQYNSIIPLVNVLINNCEFRNNNALRIGALRLGNILDFTISNSKFIGNMVTQHTASCTFASNSSGSVYNCLFAKNIANGGTSGGAGVSVSSNVDFMNCTFVNNRSGSGGGIHLRQGGIAVVNNSIFWENYPDQISLDAINDTSACTLYFNYNDIQFGSDSIHINDTGSVINWGIGNIDEYPLFVDTLNNDYHIQNLSPCIATGIDSIQIAGFWYHAPLIDIDGNPRPFPAGTMPDMGAHESQYPVKVEDNKSELPNEYILYQNFPNPFNSSSEIKYSIPNSSKVILKVFNILGNEMTTLVNEQKTAGIYVVKWFADYFPSGVYFYQIRVGGFVQTKKMLLLK